MKLILFSFTILFSTLMFAQNKEAYKIYTAKGKKSSFKKMAKASNEVDFVFFGEYHDNPISHWLQLELMQSMYAEYGDRLVLGFEMFEQDQQLLLDSLIQKQISPKEFGERARLWPNYSTDYEPLIDFAIEYSLKCVADNIPRRYASIMFKEGRKGLSNLSDEEKSWICPLDFEIDTTLSQYQEVAKMAVHIEGLDGYDLMQAQAIKDATMAYFILKNMKENSVMLHFNGAFHSDFFQGILVYVLEEKPEAKIMTISTVSQEDLSKLEEENKGRADFIIVVPDNMTSTH